MRGKLALILLACGLLLPVQLHAESGEAIHQEVMASIGPYEDPELTMYLAGLVADIVSVSSMADEQFTFTLLDSGDINAFATGGNYIYINRGLLNYISNEAELVSVLAHEVAHVTERHVDLMPIAAGGARFLSSLIGYLSGSPEVYQAGMAYANSLLKGHGRDNELEADEAAAVYMQRLGYDPEQLITMLSTMKDLEIMDKERAREQGAPRRSYHGIFSTHPRNDMRLRRAVSKAASDGSTITRDNGEERYRQMTEGLVWGENFKEKEQKPERYSDKSLRVRFDFPDGWTHGVDSQTGAVIGESEDGGARITMKAVPRTPQTPEEYLYNQLDVEQLKNGKEIAPARLKGYTGIVPGADGAPDQRIAVVFYKLNAYLFLGEVILPDQFAEYDEKFLESFDTFRPISNREIEGRKPKTIHWVQATASTTFDALGEELKLDRYEVQDLRLINGYYPTGEPRPGEWIRIFKQ